MNRDELVALFERIQARPRMYFLRGVEFWMLAGYVYGMIESGVSELKDFQRWVSQAFCGWPTSPICWDVIIAESVTKDQHRRNLTDEESQEALDRTLASLIAYCQRQAPTLSGLSTSDASAGADNESAASQPTRPVDCCGD